MRLKSDCRDYGARKKKNRKKLCGLCQTEECSLLYMKTKSLQGNIIFLNSLNYAVNQIFNIKPQSKCRCVWSPNLFWLQFNACCVGPEPAEANTMGGASPKPGTES